MFKIEFYENAKGESELWEFLESLRLKSEGNKDLRIQYKQITFYIELLQSNGTYLPEKITKHLEKDTFVLLHHFRKKTQKTPPREIEKAKSERADYLSRKENSK